MTYQHAEAKANWDRLQVLLKDDDASFYARDSLIHCGHDDHAIVPELTMEMHPHRDEEEIAGLVNETHELIRYFFDIMDTESWLPYRQEISELALAMSLCPVHFVDYAICFDDEDPECAVIRATFPNHDT